MGQNVAQKLIPAQLVSGDLSTGNEVALRIDQTLADRHRRQHPRAALGWLPAGGSP